MCQCEPPSDRTPPDFWDIPLTVAWRSGLLPARCLTRATSFGWHHFASASRDDLSAPQEVARRSSARNPLGGIMGLCLLSVRLSGPSTALRTFLINFVSHDDLLQVRFVISLRRSLREFASLLRRRGDHHGLASELTRPLSVARALLLVFNEVGADVVTRGVFDGPIGSNIFRGKNLDFAIVGFACFYRAERRRHHGDRGFSRLFRSHRLISSSCSQCRRSTGSTNKGCRCTQLGDTTSRNPHSHTRSRNSLGGVLTCVDRCWYRV